MVCACLIARLRDRRVVVEEEEEDTLEEHERDHFLSNEHPYIYAEVCRAINSPMHPLSAVLNSDAENKEKIDFCMTWINKSIDVEQNMLFTEQELALCPRVKTDRGCVIVMGNRRYEYMFHVMEDNEIGLVYSYDRPKKCWVLEVHPSWRTFLGFKKMTFDSIENMTDFVNTVHAVPLIDTSVMWMLCSVLMTLGLFAATHLC